MAKKPMTIKRQTGVLKLKIGESIADYDDSILESFPDTEVKVIELIKLTGGSLVD